MTPLVTLSGIDQAISNLNFSNSNALKSRLVEFIRRFYADENSIESVVYIDTDELVKFLWDTDNDQNAIKNRRKNFNSVKSSLNADLKKLYQQGKNPEGVVIGPDNVFIMSEEAKDKIIEKYGLNIEPDGSLSLEQMMKILKTVSETLSGLIDPTDADRNETSIKLNKLKDLLESLSEKVHIVDSGLSTEADPSETQEKPTAEISEKVDNLVEDKLLYELEETDDLPENEIVDELEETDDLTEDEFIEELEETDDLPEQIIAEEVEDFEEEASIENFEEIDDIGEFGFENENADQNRQEDITSENNAIGDDVVETEDQHADSVAETEPAGAGRGDDSAEDEYIEEIEEPDGLSENEVLEDLEEVDDSAEDEVVEELEETDDSAEDEVVEELEETDDSAEDEVVEELEETDDSAEDEVVEELEETDDLTDDEVVEELEETDDLEADEVIEDVEAADDLADDEVIDDFEEIDDSEEEVVEDLEGFEQSLASVEADEVGLPVDSLGQEYSQETEDNKTKAKLLAEEFDGYLGAMDRYFNQYVFISEGDYIVGHPRPRNNERSETTFRLAPFYMGRFPITNGLFEIFVEKTGYKTIAEKVGYGTVYYGRFQKIQDESTGLITSTWNASLHCETVEGACWYQPSGPGSTLYNKRSHPVVQIAIEDALAFAAWTGKRLPTIEEWEAAARTQNGWLYPWGPEWQNDSCNFEESCVGDTTPADKYAKFENNLGIVDTIGNVMEWTLGNFETVSGQNNRSDYYVAKGGSWISGNDVTLCNCFKLEPESHSNILGFRCVAY